MLESVFEFWGKAWSGGAAGQRQTGEKRSQRVGWIEAIAILSRKGSNGGLWVDLLIGTWRRNVDKKEKEWNFDELGNLIGKLIGLRVLWETRPSKLCGFCIYHIRTFVQLFPKCLCIFVFCVCMFDTWEYDFCYPVILAHSSFQRSATWWIITVLLICCICVFVHLCMRHLVISVLISLNQELLENIWFVWSRTYHKGEKLRCHACDGRTDGRHAYTGK